MASYIFSPDTAMDTGAELTQATQELENSLADLNTKAQAFLAANQSVSRDTYNEAQRKWDLGQQEINRALGQGIVALNEIHHEYLLGDARGTSVMQGNL
jgi:uncharacterized protein YukE